MAGAANRNEVLILGGGEGATLREVLRHPGVKRCTMVDIDGLVVDLSKKYLPEWADGAFDEPRANVIIGDALAHMRNHDEKYGVIVSDLTEPLEDSPSNILFNEDVFRLIKSRLADDGIYVLQASTAAFYNYSLHCKMARTLRRHYKHVTSFFTSCPPSIPTGPSSPAAIPSILRRWTRQQSMPIVHSFVVRISSTTGRRTGVCSRCLSIFVVRWRPMAQYSKDRMHPDFTSAPHRCGKEKSPTSSDAGFKLEM